ncbi:MAG: DUF1786 domain-containing protein [Chloroflexi bacterium]|nr:DUF1786 domain-containing protein [Chloroflexota bacterium]
MGRDAPMRILAVDVGAGTQDVLLYESDRPIENCVKLVIPSQTVVVARRIARATRAGRDIALVGNLMGGGACGSAVKEHIASGLKVYATEWAAKTLHDNLDYVRAKGVLIVPEPPKNCDLIQMGDIDLRAYERALGAFEVELPPVFAVAVQDHGESPIQSNREFRFEHLRRFLEAGGELRSLVYRDVPDYLTRMKAVQMDVPGALVMDTGPAAIWGALFDGVVARHGVEGQILVNVGNAHTLGALVQDGKMVGLFEHHTASMTTGKLDSYVRRLREATLSHEEVLEDGGHGCYVIPGYRPGSGFDFVSVTGPNRALAADLGYHFAAPFGDMMLTGCFGLVAAAKEVDNH